MPILPLLPRSFHYAPFWIPFRLCLSVRGSVLGCRAVVTWRVACQAALWAAARLSGGACLGSPNGQFLERGPAFAVAGMPVRLMNMNNQTAQWNQGVGQHKAHRDISATFMNRKQFP